MSIEPFVDDATIHLLAIPGLGLTEYETRVYFALLMAGETTPVEISRVASVPRSKTYATLENLAKKSMVEKTGQEPFTYRIAAGSVDRILDVIRKSSMNFVSRLERLKEIGAKGATASIQAELEKVCQRLGYKSVGRNKTVGNFEADMLAESPYGLKVCFDIKARADLISDSYVDQLIRIPLKACDIVVLVYSGRISDNIKTQLDNYGILACAFQEVLDGKLEYLLRKDEKTRLHVEEGFKNLENWLSSERESVARLDSLFHEALTEYNELQEHVRGTEDLKNLLNSTRNLMEKSKYAEYYIRDSLDNLGRLHQSSRDTRKFNDLLNHAEKTRLETADLTKLIEANLTKLLGNVRGLKTSRDKWYDYMLNENPFVVAPPDIVESIVNETPLKERLDRILHLGNVTRSPVAVAITGDYGVGKTHVMKYYSKKINDGAFGRSLSVYSVAKKDMVDSFREFTSQTRIEISKSRLFSAEKDLLALKPVNDYYDVIENLQDFSSGLEAQGVKQIFWFIDELENSFVEQGKETKTEKSVLLEQLRGLIDNLQGLHLSLVFSCSTSAWRYVEHAYPAIISRLQAILTIKPLENTSEVKEFFEHLIQRVRVGPGGKKLPEFSEDALKAILRVSGGNPRKIITMCRETFWEAIEKDIETIDDNLLKIPKELTYEEMQTRNIKSLVEDIFKEEKHIKELLTKNRLLTKVRNFKTPDSCPLCGKEIAYGESCVASPLLGGKKFHRSCLAKLETKQISE